MATFAGLAVALASLGEAGAEAPRPPAELPLQLSWSAPPICPDAARVQEEIRRRVGGADTSKVTLPIVAEVEIQELASESFRLLLRTSVGQSQGERELSGQDCGQLADAAALVLALLISPDAALVPEPPSASPAPTQAPPPVSESAAEPVWGRRFVVGVSGVLGWQVLPSLAEGLDLRLGVMGMRWAAVIRAGGFFAQDIAAPILPGASASFYRLEWSLAACAHTARGRRAGVGACLGGSLVRMSGESAGISNPGSVSAFWPEALAEASVELRLAAWARLRLSLEGRALGRPPDFAILGLGNVYRPASTSVRAGLGFDLLF